MTVALVIALFGGPLFVLCDVPDAPGSYILDAVMILVAILFVLEIILKWLADPFYPLSFFFFMDLLGTVSMIFELSFVEAEIGQMSTAILRSLRTAKIGARAGRMFKLGNYVTNCLQGIEERQPRVEARMLGSTLTRALATRVAALTVALILVLPLLDIPVFPTEERSMDAWAQHLEEYFAIANETNDPGKFELQIASLITFYSKGHYRPYELGGFDGFDRKIDGSQPARAQNSIRYSVAECRFSRSDCSGSKKAYIMFDFTESRQVEAAMGILMTFGILGVMMISTYDLSRLTNEMLVVPLENVLSVLRTQTRAIYDQIRNTVEDTDDVDEYNEETHELYELEIIGLTLEKVSRIAKQAMRRNSVSHEQINGLDSSDKAVLVDLMQARVTHSSASKKLSRLVHLEPWATSLSGETEALETRLQTWDVNTLGMRDEELAQLMHHIFFTSEFGLALQFAEKDEFVTFTERTKALYEDVPFHCYAHACDVLHTVFRIMSLVGAGKWLSTIQQYALLVASLCHDLGHFGKTNQFLVEAGHELAICYNDKSPLENMHCAKLFETCKAGAHAFGRASKELQKQARNVCIATILHTDNAHHFSMVQDIDQLYEIQQVHCDEQASVTGILLGGYMDNVLEPNKLKFLELFLHLADVSNPLKPFDICHPWALRVLEEFFMQGDEEKALGLPVGMLNDREKVNTPGSQHGFINFLVAPLVLNAINLFPALTGMHEQMSKNLRCWRDLWIEDAKPSQEETAKKDADLERLQTISERLRLRRQAKQVERSGSKSSSRLLGKRTFGSMLDTE
eukprot:TRINITY_DN5060_c0_g1_i3.p1 TRINITY_DN5060_c0_g1~~TRINITY_DN5060_c0_g1_i3.p1  ORF type:complete len:800 (+),score=130.72 TRINITY_DN5060_c0_g1_i3:82-2481(+)